MSGEGEGRKEGMEGTGGVTPHTHTTLPDIALFTSLGWLWRRVLSLSLE